MTFDMTRRHIMMAMGGGALAAGTLRPGTGLAAAYAGKPALLLVDASLPKRCSQQLERTHGGKVTPLRPDLVWHWRQGLREQVKAHAGPTIALVKWDKCMVLQGLAREERMTFAAERLDRQTFQVILGA